MKRWVPGAPVESIDPGPGPSRWSELSETSRQVQAALDHLPEKQREVLVLCDLEERTAFEVAELLAIPPGTVKSRLRLGRERFRRAARTLGLGPTAVPREEVG